MIGNDGQAQPASSDITATPRPFTPSVRFDAFIAAAGPDRPVCQRNSQGTAADRKAPRPGEGQHGLGFGVQPLGDGLVALPDGFMLLADGDDRRDDRDHSPR